MGHSEAVDLLQQTLDEEKATDEKLTALAEAGINQEAADGAHGTEDEEEHEEDERAAPARRRAPAAARKKTAKKR
jgi:hypothetical protein